MGKGKLILAGAKKQAGNLIARFFDTIGLTVLLSGRAHADEAGEIASITDVVRITNNTATARFSDVIGMAANHILGGDYIYEVFTASRNWVPPQGVGLIEAFVVGPGADGGAGYSSVTTAQVSGYGGAGGAGGQVVTYEISVDEGEDVSVVINNTMSYIKNDSFKAVVGGGSGGGIGSYARYAINYGSFDTRAAGGGGYGTYAFDGATIAIPGFQNRRFGAGGGGGGSRSSTYGGGDASAASGGDYGGGSGNSGGGAGGAATFYGAGGGGGSSPWSYSSSVSGGAGGAGYQGIIIIRYKINEPSNQENQ